MIEYRWGLLFLLLIAQPLISRAQNDLEKDIDKLELFLKSLDHKYVDSVETSSIVEKGIRSMLEELDPHSIYMNADQYKAASEPLAGKFTGVGIRYHVIDDTLTVLEIMKGSAADKANLRLGDQIIAIGYDTLSGRSLHSSRMTSKLKDPDKADLPVTIWRNNGKDRLHMVLDRTSVSVSSVPTYFMIDKHTGYIQLTRFSSTSLSDFRKALDDLNSQGMDNLIFDLRGNSGGYLNVAIKIVDEFLDDRKLIVYTEGSHHARKETFATSGGRFTEGDLIVLIDEHSASASEIVAGAVQDWDRGLIMGRRSFGKGLVQRTVEFDDGAAMRLTISRYYTPTGRSIQKPYDEGLREYRSDLTYRRASGELFSRDSIHVNDSLVFFTPRKRKVYGGGGIVPDVFVAADSNESNGFYRAVLRKSANYRYALNYAFEHSTEIKRQHSDVAAYSRDFEITDQMLNEIGSISKRVGVEFTDEEFAEAKQDLTRNIKSLIARFVYGYEEHFYVLANYDPVIQLAMSDLTNDTFKELGLNQ